MTYTRNRKRTQIEVDRKFSDLTKILRKKAEWDAESNDWTESSKVIIEALKRQWTRFCSGRPFSKNIQRAFVREVKIYATDQILGHKYGAKTDRKVLLGVFLDDIKKSPEIAAMEVVGANKYETL